MGQQVKTVVQGMHNRLAGFRFSLLHILLVILIAATGCERAEEQVSVKEVADPSGETGVIVAMGDSLTAGLGVSLQNSYPALLEQHLQETGLSYRVVNGGVSGETSSGARSRVNWILGMKPDLVILETGANDGLRGIEPSVVRENIGEIIEILKSRDVAVLLAGMQMVTNMGPDYLARFNRIYPELAEHHGITLMPFFLEGVALDPSLNQADGIHPNEQGHRVIAENMVPYVIQALGTGPEKRENGQIK